MVVFEDGLARKSEYRRFQIKGFEGQDDVRSMHEVITRRFKRYLAEKERTGEWDRRRAEGRRADGRRPSSKDDEGRPKRFAYPPQLVVVDGGQPQVAAAKRALDELGIDDIAVCGLAKRLEEVWLPDDDDPVVLPRTSEGLYLLQRVRDEAHRFAITYQRTKRAKRFRASPLDDVPGLGETRKQALIKHFGSVKKLRSATIDQICEVPGIGRKTAETVAVALARAAPGRPRREHGDRRDHGGRDPDAAASTVTNGGRSMTEHETRRTSRDGAQVSTGTTGRARREPPRRPSPSW